MKQYLHIALILLLLLGSSNLKGQNSRPVIIKYTGFTVQYNPDNKQPDWVEYTLTAEQVELSDNTPKVPRYFMPDPNLSLPQAIPADYKNSGWVRGHMARRQDMKWSEKAVKESDYFTNICPQNGVMNNGVWHQIENLVRRIAIRYDSVHVICGPIFTSDVYGYIGPNRLPVPDYFFKTLLIKDTYGYHAIAFICTNDDKFQSIKDAACMVDSVEKISKINLYTYLPDNIESFVESSYNLKLWDLQ